MKPARVIILSVALLAAGAAAFLAMKLTGRETVVQMQAETVVKKEPGINVLVAGANFHDNQINVGLYPREGRTPEGVTTRADAHVTNSAGYFQESLSLLPPALGAAWTGLVAATRVRVSAAGAG